MAYLVSSLKIKKLPDIIRERRTDSRTAFDYNRLTKDM